LPNISGKLVGDRSENYIYDDGGLSNFL
jgi:hypothetical protein